MRTISLPCSLAVGATLLMLSAPGLAQDQDGDGALDRADSFPCNSQYAGLAFAPAEGVHGTLLFEDEWPGPNDSDSNDVVLGYNYVYYLNGQGQVVRIVASFTPRALGGKFHTGLGLHLEIPASAVASVTRAVDGGLPTALTASTQDAEFTVDISNDLREFFGGTQGAINARTDIARQAGQSFVIDIRLSTAQPLMTVKAPHDLYIFHSNQRGHEMHRHMYPGTARMDQSLFGTEHDLSRTGRWFIDHTEIPSALELPSTAAYPAEGVEIAQLYPNIVPWAFSGGAVNQDFYTVDVQNQNAYADSNGQGPISLASPHQPTVDVSCVASDVTTPSNVTLNASNIAAIAGSNWTVPSGVTVTVDYAGPIQVYSLDLAGTIRPAGCTSSACATLDLQVITDATIRSSGRLNADGLGYLGSRNSGNGSRGRTLGNVASSASYQTGGSHGALGGRYGTTPTPAYDSANHPSYPGSGGTSYNSSSSTYMGGNGGGVIKMTVNGRLTLDGLISANGGRGGSYDTGGAGGAVWLSAGELASSTSGVRVRANGSYGYYAGGGGGRVAIYGTPVAGFSVTESSVTVQGGAAATGTPYYGGAGTVVHGQDIEGQANLLLYAPTNYNSRAGDTRLGAFGVVRGVTGTVLSTDNTLHPGSLAGRTLKPDAEGSATFVIASNTANTITIGAGSLSAATAVNRKFYVTDYETKYASATITGSVKADAGLLDVLGQTTLDSGASLDVFDLNSDVLDVSGSVALTGHNFAVRQLDTAGSSVITAQTIDFNAADLQGSSRITTWAPSTSRIYTLTLSGQDLSLSSSARLTVDGLGYLGSRNSGNGSRAHTNGLVATGASYQTGGSHGGHGGRYGTTVTASYGDLYQPITAGSGGTSYNSGSSTYMGGNGGGILRVNLTGTLLNNGTISANGGRGGSYDTGGAGGSIWINAQTIQRTATGVGMSANGSYGYYAGGGGGRIALHFGSLSGWAINSGTVHSYGGAAATGTPYYGGPGTILHRSLSQTQGHLLVHAPSNYRSRFSDTIIVPSGFDHITLVGDTHVDTTSLQLSGTLSLQGSSTLDMNDVQVGTLQMSGSTRVYGRTVVATQADLQGTAKATLHSIDASQLDLGGSTIITGWSPTTSALYPLQVTAGTLNLGSSARIQVDGLGYLGSRNSGNGSKARTIGNVVSTASYQTGGSHGGYGGRYGTTVEQQHGDIHQPVTAGGGGTSHNSSSSTYMGGNGGGVLRLDVAGTLTLDGVISANGARGGSYDTGGAGGSVWINAGTMHTNRTGSLIQSNGSYGYYAGGGGGRVALYYSNLSGWTVNSGTVQANGGAAATGTPYYGGSGPIVYQPAVNARADVLITAPSNYYSRFGRTQLGEFGLVSSVSGSVLTSNRPLRPGVLQGATLVPNAENEASTFVITGNTASTITVQGDLSSATQSGARWYVTDYASQFENLTLQGSANVEAGYLDIANHLRVEGSTDLLATDVDALNYTQQSSSRVYLKRLGYQDAVLSGSARVTARLVNGSTTDLQGSSFITGWAPSTSAVYPLHVISGDLTVGSSARLVVAGLGYLGSRNSGNGSKARTNGNVVSTASYQTGGSHGGLGGRYGSTPTPAYGHADQPVTFGAGGTSHNSSSSTYMGGNGGGVLRLDVPGTLVLNGVVDANGARGGSYDTGGAGGSIWVSTGVLNGAGIIRADGAYGYYAGGGGGRVAVHTAGGSWASSASTLHSNGGAAATGSPYYGQAGSTRYILQ